MTVTDTIHGQDFDVVVFVVCVGLFIENIYKKQVLAIEALDMM